TNKEQLRKSATDSGSLERPAPGGPKPPQRIVKPCLTTLATLRFNATPSWIGKRDGLIATHRARASGRKRPLTKQINPARQSARNVKAEHAGVATIAAG
ncbi:MAG TPA: hypothetical protein VF146_20015, partial [Bryobacteraceae bacterium]